MDSGIVLCFLSCIKLKLINGTVCIPYRLVRGTFSDGFFCIEVTNTSSDVNTLIVAPTLDHSAAMAALIRCRLVPLSLLLGDKKLCRISFSRESAFLASKRVKNWPKSYGK